MTTGEMTTTVHGFFRHRVLIILAAVISLPVLAIGVTAAGRLIGNGAESDVARNDPELVKQIIDIRQRIADLKTLVDENPMKTLAVKEIADAYLEMGTLQEANGIDQDAQASYQLAVNEYEHYLALDPNDEDATIYLSLAHLSLDEHNEAIRIMEEQSRATPGSQKTWYVMGWVFDKSERKTEAEWAWEKALRIDPNSRMAPVIEDLLARLETNSSSPLSVKSPDLPEGHP